MSRRVVVTGLGLVSCLGHGYRSVLARLEHGESGLRAMPEWDGLGLKSLVAGPIDDLDAKPEAARLPKRLVAAMSDAALFCALAAQDAVADAGLAVAQLQHPGTGCVVGSGVGSVDTVWETASRFYGGQARRMDPYSVLRSMSSSASAAVANLLGTRGRSYSLSSACATSAHNIGHAYELIRWGALDRAVAGGGEDMSQIIAGSFQALRLALSTHYNEAPTLASRPYDVGRDDFVLSGGSGIVILEALEQAQARGARIRAELVGHGANSDGFDLVLPEPEGHQVAACIRSALADAELAPSVVDYVNTHATSTIAGDIAEVRALQEVFGDSLPPFSSTKSMTGHAMGAAGALEAIFCTGMIERGFMAPSINIERLDPALEGLPIVTRATRRDLTTVVSTNLGFGAPTPPWSSGGTMPDGRRLIDGLREDGGGLARAAIRAILPYGDAFLFLDRVSTLTETDLEATYAVPSDSPLLQAHFVGFPVLPASLITEGFGQAGSILIRYRLDSPEDQDLVALQVARARIFSPVFPGDVLEYRVHLGAMGSRVARLVGETWVGTRRNAKINLTVGIVSRRTFRTQSFPPVDTGC